MLLGCLWRHHQSHPVERTNNERHQSHPVERTNNERHHQSHPTERTNNECHHQSHPVECTKQLMSTPKPSMQKTMSEHIDRNKSTMCAIICQGTENISHIHAHTYPCTNFYLAYTFVLCVFSFVSSNFFRPQSLQYPPTTPQRQSLL